MRASKIAASMGLPSSVAAILYPLPSIPNHEETGLDPAIHSQATGNQRAMEVRTDLSRSR